MPTRRTPSAAKAPEQPSLIPETPSSKSNGDRMTATERDGYLRLLRTNVKTAKAAILGRAAELKAAFEIQLDTMYPPDGDPVWEAEYQAAVKDCEVHVKRIEKRCDELGIGHRFRPSLHPPYWS